MTKTVQPSDPPITERLPSKMHEVLSDPAGRARQEITMITYDKIDRMDQRGLYTVHLTSGSRRRTLCGLDLHWPYAVQYPAINSGLCRRCEKMRARAVRNTSAKASQEHEAQTSPARRPTTFSPDVPEASTGSRDRDGNREAPTIAHDNHEGSIPLVEPARGDVPGTLHEDH
jgi:hypothetical protein